MKKSLVVMGLSVALVALGHSATAQVKAAPFDPTTFTPPARSPLAGPRPLLRYLITALELPEQQAIRVQRVLKANAFPTPTLEELTARLQPVLTDNQFDRLLGLQNDAPSTRTINYLAALH